MKKNQKAKRPEFEDVIDKINLEISKRRGKWNLTILAWMDFDDVSQIIRIHIWKKWKMYDPEKPLAPWLNRIISNQIKKEQLFDFIGQGITMETMLGHV